MDFIFVRLVRTASNNKWLVPEAPILMTISYFCDMSYVIYILHITFGSVNYEL